MSKNQHVTPHPQGGWQVKGAGNQRATVPTETQADAIAIAREIAINNNSKLFIHGTDDAFEKRTRMETILIRLKANKQLFSLVSGTLCINAEYALFGEISINIT